MKISINLLPPEIRAQELKKAKFYKVQFTGVAVILVMIFLSSLTIALRILQSHNISEAQAKITQTEQRISGLKDTEASLSLLKNRLTVINQYMGVPSNQSTMYKLIGKLLPPAVVVNTISVDKSGGITFMAMAPDPVSLDSLLDNLISKEENEGKISKISIDSLNRGRDGYYRINLTIK